LLDELRILLEVAIVVASVTLQLDHERCRVDVTVLRRRHDGRERRFL